MIAYELAQYVTGVCLIVCAVTGMITIFDGRNEK